VFQGVKTFVFWLVILLSAILLWKIVRANDYGKEREITFSQFMQDVDQGSVATPRCQATTFTDDITKGTSAFTLLRPRITPR
jgi:cytoskeletal protein RodZ